MSADHTTQRKLPGILARIALGIAVGYLAYLPAVAMILFIAYGRVERDMFVYNLYLPIQLPLLANADFRESLTANEILLQSFSLILMAFTTFAALTMRREQPPVGGAEIKHG